MTRTQLSVNVNKYALLRNARGHNTPDLLTAVDTCLRAGAHGITVHPRRDERHIQKADVPILARHLADHWPGVELNVECEDHPEILEVVHAVRPAQCTLVPVTPGGNADVVARTVAQGMTEQLKQSVVVENRPGANAMIGAEAVARSAPDGYTLLLATAESHAINPHIYKKVNYDAVKDFSAVGVIGYFPFALVINPKLSAQNLAEFVELFPGVTREQARLVLEHAARSTAAALA
jgi:hypothetical protein